MTVGLASSPYDTAWLASLRERAAPGVPRFPAAMRWLLDHQLPDGSWGGVIPYEHDRVLCTLAALAAFGPDAAASERTATALRSGSRYLWQNAHRLAAEPVELVAFELLLPALIARARRAGVDVPPHLDTYGPQRAEKLRLIPGDALYSPHAPMIHSIEFLGDDVDVAALRAARGANGSLGNSPAATAFLLSHTPDSAAEAYLEACLARRGDGSVAVAEPCETFELLWAAYHLHLGGVPAAQLIGTEERAVLRDALRQGGVSWSAGFLAPDADNTAVALVLLRDAGDPVDAGVLGRFDGPAGHFISYPFERHASAGVNIHVLHALLCTPGYAGAPAAIERILAFLAEQQVGGLYWQDKWHISPYYATSHALQVLAHLPRTLAARAGPLIQGARDWLRHTQNADGSWGFYDVPTAEETAYGVLGLSAGDGAGPNDDASGRALGEDQARCHAGAAVLRSQWYDRRNADGAEALPALWIEKCLYAPPLIVRAAIEAALLVGENGTHPPAVPGRRRSCGVPTEESP